MTKLESNESIRIFPRASASPTPFFTLNSIQRLRWVDRRQDHPWFLIGAAASLNMSTCFRKVCSPFFLHVNWSSVALPHLLPPRLEEAIALIRTSTQGGVNCKRTLKFYRRSNTKGVKPRQQLTTQSIAVDPTTQNIQHSHHGGFNTNCYSQALSHLGRSGGPRLDAGGGKPLGI